MCSNLKGANTSQGNQKTPLWMCWGSAGSDTWPCTWGKSQQTGCRRRVQKALPLKVVSFRAAGHRSGNVSIQMENSSLETTQCMPDSLPRFASVFSFICTMHPHSSRDPGSGSLYSLFLLLLAVSSGNPSSSVYLLKQTLDGFTEWNKHAV